MASARGEDHSKSVTVLECVLNASKSTDYEVQFVITHATAQADRGPNVSRQQMAKVVEDFIYDQTHEQNGVFVLLGIGS
ncbi:hypothetical protein OO5_00585 [Enterococcus faecalis V583]|uniref:hypothetical protein n=1 Tax=Enterococcus faecalis TaxID=1351 RepID=UPI00033FC4D1|nr:hypothetical protein [Enterococcus faecalis]EOT51995.1 hypothetical protein OO5_00585 [Enterococcus faecalis V583]